MGLLIIPETLADIFLRATFHHIHVTATITICIGIIAEHFYKQIEKKCRQSIELGRGKKKNELTRRRKIISNLMRIHCVTVKRPLKTIF